MKGLLGGDATPQERGAEAGNPASARNTLLCVRVSLNTHAGPFLITRNHLPAALHSFH